MANYTYAPQLEGPANGYALFTDKQLSAPATLFDANGAQLPASQIVTNGDGTWPTFSSPSPVLYFSDADGVRTALTPSLAYGSPQTVTGAKGSNAALGSLIAGLIALGVPIVDNTTA